MSALRHAATGPKGAFSHMNHPSREEWGLYLFGEASPDLNKKLDAHLKECPACAEEVKGLRRTMQRLDAWQYPKPVVRVRFAPVLRLAAAAAIVLAVGVGLGRVTAPPQANLVAAKAELRASLLNEFQNLAQQNEVSCSNLVAAAEQRIVRTTEDALNTLGSELIEAVNLKSEADRRQIQTVIDQLNRQRQADYVSLRRDLETVAAAADEEIRQAHFTMLQLANFAPANQ